MIRLDIFSDPICPWCYIGKTFLDRALESRPDHPFAIEWHPFQLNPDMRAGGLDRQSYLAAKFGGAARAEEVYERVREAARGAGVDLNLDAIARTPNTLDAHRLLTWAGIEGAQSRVKGALFRAYFREGRDIGDAEVLADVAASCGMDREMVLRLLASDADRDAVEARDAHAREKGIRAVPTFIVAEKYVVQGAQPVAFWQTVIDEIGQMEAEEG